MSDIGTKIIGTVLVDEGIAYEKLEKRVKELESLISSTKPICPICKIEMEPSNYEGYYDSFSYWGCDCKSFPNVKPWRGQYA